MRKTQIAFLVLFAIQITSHLYAQDYNDIKPGESKFMLRGYAHAGLEAIGDDLSFVGGSFNPIFLWQQNDRLIFEGELEISANGNETEIELEYANISYLVNQYMTLRLGKFLLPFGIFSERLHPAWINKLSTMPLGFGHHDPVGPTADYGIELRGAIPIQNHRIAYSVYATNGPALNDGADDPQEAGSLLYTRINDNNRNKAIGGRVGVFPFSNSSLEIGLSGQIAQVGEDESEFEDVWGMFSAIDISLIRSIPSLKSVIDVRGQYNNVFVDEVEYPMEFDEHGEMHPFENASSTFFGQFSIRPAYINTPILKQLEFVGRYSKLQTAEEAPWESNATQTAIGISYWLDWRSVLKFSYQVNKSETIGEDLHDGGAEDDHDTEATNGFYIHWAIGF